MILRKPYAFIIKHFKLLHLILLALFGISIYRLSAIGAFLKQYLENPVVFNRFSVDAYFTTNNITEMLAELDSLFPFYVFLVPLIVILVTLVILFILYSKKKPYLLYIIIITYSIALLAFYGIIYNLVSQMQTTLVDTRFANIMRDFTNIVMIAGIILSIFILVRATGFDIKKFNFVKDLQELDISEEDNAEFEVELNVDSNVIRRKIRKIIRYLKYTYYERRFIINLALTSVIVIAGFVIYFVVMVHHKDYNQTATFGSSDFTMHIDNVYLTNKDYLGNVISDKYLVIVDLDIKSSYAKGKRLDISNCALIVNDKKYLHTAKYRDLLYDIGTVYEDNLIYSRTENNKKRTDFKTNYLLVYEIPASYIDDKMTFRYTMDFDVFADTVRPKYARVKLTPINLDKNIEVTTYELADSISFKQSVMSNLYLTIDSYEINQTMAEYYRFCTSTKECFDSVEYITPSIGNIDKTVLKLTGKLENSNIVGIYNLYNLVDKFGKIEYKIGDTTKKTSIIGKINTNHNSNDTYYIEIPKEVEQADKISLKFNVRNKVYEYILKQPIEQSPKISA